MEEQQMSVRSTISRREPVIALKPFRFLGRNYKEGAPLDRRRCRMPHSKLLRLIRTGFCILAKDMNPEKLLKYGFVYNTNITRMKLSRLTGAELNQWKMDHLLSDESDPMEKHELKHVGGGWWNVLVDNKPVNKNLLRKDAAKNLIKKLKTEG